MADNALSTRASRRTILGASIAIPAMIAGIPATAAARAPKGSRWAALVADYWQKRAASCAAADAEDEHGTFFGEACKALAPEPVSPGSGLPDNILAMTIAEIKAPGDNPEHKAAWVAYERDHAAWTAERDTLRLKIVGPAEAHYTAAFAAYTKAYRALLAHRVASVTELCGKLEILADDSKGCHIEEEEFAEILADVRALARRA